MKQLLSEILQASKGFWAGFLGWFIYANLVFIAIVATLTAQTSANGVPYILLCIWLPTIITLIILFKTKKNSLAMGILTAVLVNGAAFVYLSTGRFPTIILFPQPSAIILYMSLIMDAMSPPYSTTYLFDLFK